MKTMRSYVVLGFMLLLPWAMFRPWTLDKSLRVAEILGKASLWVLVGYCPWRVYQELDPKRVE